MIRFLRYAVERERKIRAMLLLNGVITQKTVRVLSYDQTSATLQIGAKKQPVIVLLKDILSCDYARGDHGEE